MRSFSSSLLGLGICLLAAGAPVPDQNDSPPAPAPKKVAPSEEEIKKAIEDLGNKRFVVRDRAKKFLAEAGAAAEPLLRQAAKSSDEEVANAAKSILDRFDWGLYPDTPEALRELIEQFRSGTPEERQNALATLMRTPNVPLATLRKLVSKEENPENRTQLLARMVQQLRETLPTLLARGDLAGVEEMFNIALEGPPGQIANDYAVFMTLRGTLDVAIGRFAKQAKQPGEEGQKAQVILAHLYRQQGDWDAARKAAEASKDEELLSRVLWRSFDWKRLAAEGRPPEFGEFLPVGAAYDRLAGNKKGYEEKVTKLKEMAEEQMADWVKLRMDTNALLLNGRANDAIRILADKNRELGFTFDLLCSQMRHKEAFDLVKQARRAVNNAPEQPNENQPEDADTRRTEQQELDIRRARMLYLLGEKDSALQIFAKVADQVTRPEHVSLARDLVKAEARAGLGDLAREHAALCLAALARAGQTGGLASILEPVFGDNKEVAVEWWSLFREEKPNEEPAVSMKRVRDLLAGKLPRKDLDEWVDKLSKQRASDTPAHELRRRLGLHHQAIAAAYKAAGDDKLVLEAMTKEVKTRHSGLAWQRLGDFHMERKRYGEAADAYAKAAGHTGNDAIEIDVDDSSIDFAALEGRSPALPTYLQAMALKLAGDAARSKKLADIAHWMPLGNEVVRASLVDELNKRGWTEMARKEADFLLKTGWYTHYTYGNVLSFLARQAAAEKDYLTAADYYEKCLVGCLRTGATFIEPTAYLQVPESVRVYRARGLLGTGKIEEALAEANANLEVMPGNVDLAIKMVPELEAAGKKKEAEEIYTKVRDAWVKLCKDYPSSAYANNSAAWVMANCRRDLDEALKHAQKANEVEPKNAGYMDTLAEVHFRKGNREEALRLMKQCVELDPKHAYFKKQLTRFKDQPFDSPTPDEHEEE